jgi:hypothetical protein
MSVKGEARKRESDVSGGKRKEPEGRGTAGWSSGNRLWF